MMPLFKKDFFFLIPEHGTLSYSFPLHCSLGSSQFVCQLFGKRPCLAVCLGRTHRLAACSVNDMESCLSLIRSFFSKTSPCCSNAGIDFFLLLVSLSCLVCLRYLNFVPFSSFVIQFLHFHCLFNLPCILSFLCVFQSQLSVFPGLDSLNVFPFAFIVVVVVVVAEMSNR